MGTDITSPVAGEPDATDEQQLRHGREVHIGHPIGRFLQPPPFFFTKDKWPVPLVDRYQGGAAFLIAGGPSFATLDHSKLEVPGILTMGLNNSVKTFRPNLWTCVDNPANFLMSIWLDQTIEKFSPISHIDKPIFDSTAWNMTDITVGDCPNVWFYKRNEKFNAEQFLWEDTINWGNHKSFGSGRSVLLAAIRILFLLGIRKVFLLGVDLDMSSDKKYHFEQNRDPSSIRGNRSTYKQLEERFKLLRPHFDAAEFNVFNCNPTSKLTAFDYKPYDEAIQLALHANFPKDITHERTEGLYDRKANETKRQNLAAKPTRPMLIENRATSPAKQLNQSCTNCSRPHINQIKAQLEDARTALHEAKAKTNEYRKLGDLKVATFDPMMFETLVKDETDKRTSFRQLIAVRDNMLGIK